MKSTQAVESAKLTPGVAALKHGTNSLILRSSLMARATSSAAWLPLSPSSSSRARRSLLSALRPSTSPASSSALSVRRYHPPKARRSERQAQTCLYRSLRQLSKKHIANSFHSQVPRLPPQGYPLQPYPRWSLPLPRSLAHLLQGRPWHDPPQDCPRCRRS